MDRRNLVLQKMLDQGCITRAGVRRTRSTSRCRRATITPPHVDDPRRRTSRRWVRQQLVDQLGAAAGVRGRPARSRRRSTSTCSRPPQQAVNSYLSPDRRARRRRSWRSTTRPARSARWSAAATTTRRPFNLATQGQRQPGSSFKPFILADGAASRASARARSGRRASASSASHNGRQREVRRQQLRGRVRRPVDARQRADVLRQLGLRRASASRSGPRRSPTLAERMGIRTPVSIELRDDARRPASEGVTPLDMAHAYETFATGGKRISGTLGAEQRTARSGSTRSTKRRRPQGRRQAQQAARRKRDPVGRARRRRDARCMTGRRHATAPAARAQLRRRSRPARPARPRTTATPGSSASPTRCTVAVWVGYPDKLEADADRVRAASRSTGGTFPALIWHDFMVAGQRDRRRRATPRSARRKGLPPQEPTHAGADDDARRADGRRRRERRRRRRAATARPAAPSADGDDAAGGRRTPARATARRPTAARRRRRRHRRPRRRRRRHRRRRRRHGRAAPAAAPARRPERRRRRRRGAQVRAATGATRSGCPRAQKRHGSSTAFVIPIRGPATSCGRLPARPRAARSGSGRRRGRCR